jgi:hypothetical protein
LRQIGKCGSGSKEAGILMPRRKLWLLGMETRPRLS